MSSIRCPYCGSTQRDGALWNRGEVVETPTEKDYFKMLGVPWREPKERIV